MQKQRIRLWAGAGAVLGLAALAGPAQAQTGTNYQVDFSRCQGTIEQRTSSTERGVSRFRLTPSGEIRGRANTASGVFELGVLSPGSNQWANFRSGAMAMVRAAPDVYVLTASLVANNQLMNYSMTLPMKGREAAILVATDALGNSLYRGTCSWSIKAVR